MQLSLKTDYALRVLMALASTDEVLSVDWMAEHDGISRNHLAKVAQQLNANGLVNTTRGRSGGIGAVIPIRDASVALAMPERSIDSATSVNALSSAGSMMAS